MDPLLIPWELVQGVPRAGGTVTATLALMEGPELTWEPGLRLSLDAVSLTLVGFCCLGVSEQNERGSARRG